MLDFRKLFLTVVALALFASVAMAQVVAFEPPLSCTAQAAGTPSIRDNGVTEMVGDVLIICTGGRPRPLDEYLPQVNIQVFTSPVINITSRITGTSGGNWSEALLFIDEPQPAEQTICGSSAYPEGVGLGSGQLATIGVCGNHVGTGIGVVGPGGGLYGSGIGAYNPGTPAPAVSAGTYPRVVLGGSTPTYRGNAYQGRYSGNNSLIWQGIPIDPPGTNTTRVFRITNVRVNASQLNNPRGNQSSVLLIVSTNASGVTNPIAMPITNPSPTVAIAQTPMDFSIDGGVDTFLQCESQNYVNSSGSRFATSPADQDLTSDNGGIQNSQFNLRYDERFPTVFRRRSTNVPASSSDDSPPVITNDQLGLPYQTETGHYKTSSSSRWPLASAAAAQRGNLTNEFSGAGVATHGTRVIARFANLPQGARFFAIASAQLRATSLVGTDLVQTGWARAVVTDANGSAPFAKANVVQTCSASTCSDLNLKSSAQSWVAPTTGNGIVEIVPVGNAATQTWEILQADTTAFESLRIPFIVAYQANTSSNLPTLGTASASGHLAPLSTTATASSSAPIPRFVEDPANNNKNMFTINACVTNLLFPFVTNQGPFDTGLAIANTSKDPFGTSLQTGACTVNFYGYIGSNKVCLAYPSPSITGGEHFAWSLSSGGAVTATAGFQGYVIAQCAFQYAHGYAFISDLGAQRLAQGYVALVLDSAIGSRTGSKSEVLGH